MEHQMVDPVVADEVQHQVGISRSDAYQSEIMRLMADLSGTTEGRNTLTEYQSVSEKLDMFLSCLLNSNTSASIEHAQRELHVALVVAQTQEAGNIFRTQLRIDEESALKARAKGFWGCAA